MKQMKRIVVWTSIFYAGYVDGATIHVTGPDERQVEFGDGTTSFATLSGGEGFINSTVTVTAPDFVTMTGTSMNEMMALIRQQQVALIAQQAELNVIRAACTPAPSGPPPSGPQSPPANPSRPPLPPAPPPGQYIYVLGGYACRTIPCQEICRHRYMEQYDPNTNSWSGAACAPSSRPLQQVTMTALNGYIYAVGGDGHGLPGGSAEQQNLRYDPSANSWTSRASATYDIGTSAVSLFGYMYVFGRGIIQRYDPNANSWSQMGSMPSGYEIPSGRPLWPSVAVLDHLIYFAGWDDKRLLSYDPGDGTAQGAVWTPLAPMQCKRKQVNGLVPLDGFLYAAGVECNGTLLAVERYNPALDTWAFVASNVGTFDEVPYHMQVFGSYIYAFSDSQSNSETERYDPADGPDGTWTVMNGMTYPRGAFGLAAI